MKDKKHEEALAFLDYELYTVSQNYMTPVINREKSVFPFKN